MNYKKNIYSYKKVYLSLIGILFLFSSCVRHSEMQTEGAAFFQGVWKQESKVDTSQTLNYTLHDFKITCDSMYATFHVHNKIKTSADSCYGDGNWTEYAKAVYVQRGDSIIVEGLYTKPNGKQKISGCYRSGPYVPRFKIAYAGKDSIVLENRFEARPIILKKVADITCVPKKRWEM